MRNEDLDSFSSDTLFAELESNSSSEVIYLDHVKFSSAPAPGSITMDGSLRALSFGLILIVKGSPHPAKI